MVGSEPMQGQANQAEADGFIHGVTKGRSAQSMSGPREVAAQSGDRLLDHANARRASKHRIEHAYQPKEHAPVELFATKQASVAHSLMGARRPPTDAVPALQKQHLVKAASVAEARQQNLPPIYHKRDDALRNLQLARPRGAGVAHHQPRRSQMHRGEETLHLAYVSQGPLKGRILSGSLRRALPWTKVRAIPRQRPRQALKVRLRVCRAGQPASTRVVRNGHA